MSTLACCASGIGPDCAHALMDGARSLARDAMPLSGREALASARNLAGVK